MEADHRTSAPVLRVSLAFLHFHFSGHINADQAKKATVVVVEKLLIERAK